MEFIRDHILSIVCYLPAIGALAIILFVDKTKTRSIKTIATMVAAADFVLSIPLWFLYDRGTHAMQFVEHYEWIPSLGVDYHFGIDGISLLLILLTTMLGVIAVYCSFTAIEHREKEYYSFILMLQTGMLGVFMSLDFILFYVFWEVMLVPMYFLIGVWGGPRKLYAAIKFFLYTLVGSVLLLLGILALYFYNTTGVLGWQGLGNEPTFSVMHFHEIGHGLPLALQILVFLGFFVGFAIKVPMFPFHTWLPDAHVEAPTAGSIILAGVLLKMGTYGFVRFSLPILPGGMKDPRIWGAMAALSIIGIIYGALTAMAQKDMKKLVAYSSVSHLGFVMLGIFALNPPGLNGGILQMINHGISTGALFLLVGIVYERRHTRMIADYGGLSKQMPFYATIFLIMTLSSIGLPTLNGFIGEFPILMGAFDRNWMWAAWAGLGIVLGAAYMLWLYQRVFFGPLDNPENQKLTDLSRREAWTLLPLVFCAFWIGLYPKPFFDILEKPVAHLVEQVDPGYHARAAMKPPPPLPAAGPGGHGAAGGAGGHGTPAAGHDGAPASASPAPHGESAHE